MNILIVDDSADQRELTEAALRTAGYREVRGAESAAEAYAMLGIGSARNDLTPVDIVLLDIVMPEIDGIEACATIRSDDRFNTIPIIMVTSLDDTESLANAFVAGANDYITKPIDRVELTARVRSALKLKLELDRRSDRERELLNFISHWGSRRTKTWIDDATGLFSGEALESYLTTKSRSAGAELVSVITLAIDRLDSIKAAQGDEAAHAILCKVAKAVRAVSANLGVVAGAYRNGLFVIVAPDFAAAAVEKLAQAIRKTITHLGLANSEFIAADHITVSAAVVTAEVESNDERAKLLIQAVANVQRSEAEGGDRITKFEIH